MALKKTLTKSFAGFSGQVQADDVYYKVEQVSGDKQRVEFTMRGYKDGAHVDSFSQEFKPNMDGGNYIQQAYLHVKTLPEFTGAEDC
jgi:hypothetical protein